VSWYRDQQGASLEYLDKYYNPAQVAEKVKVFAFKDADWRISPQVRVCAFRSFAELHRHVREFKPDVIRCYEAARPFSDYALRLALELRVPSYLSLHDARVRRPANLALFTAITAYTQQIARAAEAQLGRPVETNLNGIDPQLFLPKETWQVDPQVAGARHRIVTVTREDPVKNTAVQMAATRLLSETLDSVAHVLVGPGTEDIESDGIHLGVGVLSQSRLAEYLNWCNVFLQVQLITDLSMAPTEALMIGRPIIVSADPSGNTHHLIDETLGVLTPVAEAGNPARIAEALRTCLQKTYDAEHIRRWAIETYAQDRLFRQQAQRYRDLVAGVYPYHAPADSRRVSRLLTSSGVSAAWARFNAKVRRSVRVPWQRHIGWRFNVAAKRR